MTPLGFLILKAMRFGAQGSALFVALAMGIEVWKAGGNVTRLDPGFTTVLAVLLLAALWLARSIARELSRQGS
jgi:hypothetical protein